MSIPKFSIVIPTKDRPHTLRFTLQTCLNQTFEKYEIIVCDNCSSPEVKSIVDSFSNAKIRYIRSDVPLSMTENWNLAYSAISGEYIIYIGDDDGLMPDSLRILDTLLLRYQPSAIVWQWAVYTWPDFICSEAANYLRIPLNSILEWLPARQTIQQVLNGDVAPNLLPNVYHGLIKREVLDQIRLRTGNVFHGWYPDTFTSFSVASLIPKHLAVNAPISVIALSGASNGAALIYSRNKHPVANSFRAAARGAGQKLHPWVADIPSLWSVLADSFLQSKSRLFPDDEEILFDRRQFVKRWMQEMPADSDEEQREIVTAIRATLTDDETLTKWFDTTYHVIPIRQQRSSLMPARLGFDGESLHLSVSELGIRNVEDAVRVTVALTGRNRNEIEFPEPIQSEMVKSRPTQSSCNFLLPKPYLFLVWERIKSAVRMRLGRAHSKSM